MPRQTKQQRIEELEAELEASRRREAALGEELSETRGELLDALRSLENYRADHIQMLVERNAELEAGLRGGN